METAKAPRSKVKRTLLIIWAVVTVAAILLAWIQTTRLQTSTRELERVQSQTQEVLLTRAQEMLDTASGQAANRNLGNAETNTDAAIALLEAAADVADDDASESISQQAAEIRQTRGLLIQGDEQRQASGDLKRQASEVRALQTD